LLGFPASQVTVCSLVASVDVRQMASLVLVEQQAALRAWCQLHLESAGHHVVCLENSRQVLDSMLRQQPDLVLVDIDEDGVDGLALAAAMRSNTRTARLPLIFICGPNHPDRAAQAAAIEPTGLLMKPLTRTALLGSVASQIDPANHSSIPTLERAELPPRSPVVSGLRVGEIVGGPSVSVKNATVLVVTVRNFVQLARACASSVLEELVQGLLSRASECVTAHGGWIARMDGTGFAAVFDGATRDNEDHPRLAIETGLEVILAARHLKHSFARSHSADHFPDISIGCGIHTGELVIARLSMAGGSLPTMAGETPQVAYRVEGRAKGLGWSVAATETALARSASRFSVGRQASLTDTERRAIVPIFEILGISPSTVQAAQLPHVADVREAVGANSVLATLSGDVDADTDDRTVMISVGRTQTPRTFPVLPGRRPDRWLDRGGLSRMVAAHNASTHEQEAVKFIMVDECAPNFADRFLEEYERASQIDQRNVVSVRQVGRTPALAFAAMEFLAGGPVAQAIRKKLSIGVALNYLAQMCLGLDAVHGADIAHGGLTAEHFLFRKDGAVVLADFGITQRVARNLGIPLPGVASGYARYLAPERLTGIDAGPASDFYSLGVIFLEMLLGEQAVRAAGVPLCSSVRQAGGPELPLQLSPLQPVVDRLLASDPAQRVSSGEDVLVELLAVRDVFSFDFAPKG
jgi:class 3 adenylate cyclase